MLPGTSGNGTESFLLSEHPDFIAVQTNLESIASLLQRTKSALLSRSAGENAAATQLPKARSFQVKAKSCDAAMVRLRNLDDTFRSLLVEAAIAEGSQHKSLNKSQVKKLVSAVASSGQGASLLRNIEENKSAVMQQAEALKIALDRLIDEGIPQIRQSLDELRKEVIAIEGEDALGKCHVLERYAT